MSETTHPAGCATYIQTETEFLVCDDRFPSLEPDLHRAMCEWLRFHDIDPDRVPMDALIVRNVPACRVEYAEYVFDELGDRVCVDGDEAVLQAAVSQGEAPPLPFPTAPPGSGRFDRARFDRAWGFM